MHRRELLHLLGGAAAAPALAKLPTDRLLAVGRSLPRGQYQLRVLDPHQNETVATIAEMIIPETDTPGARTARVNEFIDLLLAEWYTEEEKARFLQGLADVDQRSRSLFGADFVAATEPRRTAILRGMDAEVQALREAKAEPDQHFFARMKNLTLFGYYTSEVGMTQELRYKVIPGRYDGCVPLGQAPMED